MASGICAVGKVKDGYLQELSGGQVLEVLEQGPQVEDRGQPSPQGLKQMREGEAAGSEPRTRCLIQPIGPGRLPGGRDAQTISRWP